MYALIFFVIYCFEPFVSLITVCADMSGYMLKPGVLLRTMPVLHSIGDVDDVAGF